MGFGQQEEINELIIFLKNYQCDHRSIGSTNIVCCDEDKIDKLDSLNVIDWVQDSMWYNDNVSYEKCISRQLEFSTHYTDYGDAQLYHLNELVDKYFNIVKILATEEKFSNIKENQRIYNDYSSGWTMEGYGMTSGLLFWGANTVKIQDSLTEIQLLRIKQLRILIHFAIKDLYQIGDKF